MSILLRGWLLWGHFPICQLIVEGKLIFHEQHWTACVGAWGFLRRKHKQQEEAAPVHPGVLPALLPGPIPCIRMARMSTHFQGDLSLSTYPIPESSLYGRDLPP